MSDTARPMAELPAIGLSWARAVPSPRGAARWLPQAISHRGYKARFPENSIAAFRGAVRAGAHAIETDVHLSADGIAVLSHDPTLERCFGCPRRICDCDWDYLAGLRTLDGDPPQAMPRLRDFLAWLTAESPDHSDSDSDSGQEIKEGGQDAEVAGHRRFRVWILLDIKMDDDPELLLDAIATAISQVPPGVVPWKQRIILGCWNASTILAARRALPDFPLAHIGFSLSYAQHFLPTLPGLALNMAHNALVAPWRDSSFLRTVRGRPVFAWTVNAEHAMRWAVSRNTDASAPAGCIKQQQEQKQRKQRLPLVDGVVTDDPALFLDLCRRYEDELDGVLPAPLPAPSEPSPLTSALHFCLDHVWFKLLFLYRRFWLRKLDYLR